jgi:hypothetical protein
MTVVEQRVDPVLGTYLEFRGRRSWWWRRIALYILFVVCSLIFLALGESGYQPGLPHNALILSLWPLMLPLLVVFGWGLVLALLDGIGPRYVELRVGETGFALTKGKVRRDVSWSSVRAIEIDSSFSFWRPSSVRVTLKHPRGRPRQDQPRPEDSISIRTDLMSLRALEIVSEMSAAHERWHDQSQTPTPS